MYLVHTLSVTPTGWKQFEHLDRSEVPWVVLHLPKFEKVWVNTSCS